jgi:hypothetical protein
MIPCSLDRLISATELKTMAKKTMRFLVIIYTFIFLVGTLFLTRQKMTAPREYRKQISIDDARYDFKDLLSSSQQYDGLMEQLNTSLARAQEVLARHGESMQTASNHVGFVKRNQDIETATTTRFSTTSSHPQRSFLPQVTKLFSDLPDLSVHSKGAMVQSLRMAKDELQQHLLDPDWHLLSSFFKNKQWTQFDFETTFNATCRTARQGAPKYNSSLAQQLADTISARIQNRLAPTATKQNQQQYWHYVFLEATAARIEQAFESIAKRVVANVQLALQNDASYLERKSNSSIDANNNNNSACARAEQAVGWLEAGLDAYSKRQSVRQALARAIGYDSVVLLDKDASVGVFVDRPPPRSVPDTINLRRALDKPLTRQAAKWVDQLLDLTGGYSDFIDQKMDALSQGRDDLGSLLIEYLLNLAGAVEIPVPEHVRAKQLQQQH